MSGNLPEPQNVTGANSLREEYLSIPIPQRKRKELTGPAKRRSLISFVPKIHFRQRSWQPLSPAQRMRRKEFIQSVFAALCVNLLIVGALLMIAIDPLDLSDGQFFTATLSTENNEEEQASESESAGSSQAESENPSSVDITGMSPASLKSLALSPVDLQMTSQDINAPSLMFGQSVVKSDFDASEDAVRKKMQAFVDGKGSFHLKSNGVAYGITGETLKGLFPKSKLGNGASTAVLVDMSGSMQRISRAVEAYIDDTFPQGVTRHVNGCALKRSNDPFFRALASETRKERRTDYYFVCDLRDGETGEGISRIRNCLALGRFPKRLHIISFSRQPGRHLAKLLEVTDGTFTYVDPKLDQ